MSEEGGSDEVDAAPERRRRRRKRKPRPKYDSNYRIEIIGRRCTAVGTCMDEASRTFDMNDDAIAFVSNPNGNSDEEILAAAKSCPVDAIFLYDKQSGERVWPLRDKRFDKQDSTK
jgi:ferredoxin